MDNGMGARLESVSSHVPIASCNRGYADNKGEKDGPRTDGVQRWNVENGSGSLAENGGDRQRDGEVHKSRVNRSVRWSRKFGQGVKLIPT